MSVRDVAARISLHGGIDIFQRFDKRGSSHLHGGWIYGLSSGTSQIWQCTRCGRGERPVGQRSVSTQSVLHLSCPTHSNTYRRVPGFTLKIAAVMFVERLGNFLFFARRYAEFRFRSLIDKSKILSTGLTCG